MTDIVLATDGSKHSLSAARFLCEADLVRPTSKVHVVHVSAQLTGRATALMSTDAVTRWHAEDSADAIDPVVEILRQGGIAAEGHALVGKPAPEIVAYAKSLNARMIVMGAHGRGMLVDALIGSVAGKVLSQASCPVLLVR